MGARHIFAACLFTTFQFSYILCGDHSSYWTDFKRSISQPQHFDDHERREHFGRENSWGSPHSHKHPPHSFEEEDIRRDFSRFPIHQSREDDWNFGGNDDAPLFNEGNIDDRARGDRGPVTFPSSPASGTEQTTTPSRPATNPSRFPTPPRRFHAPPRPFPPSAERFPGPPRWPPRYPDRPMSYPRQPTTMPSIWESSSTPNPMTVSTPAVPGMQTRRPPCEEVCQTTPEYNPICGSDNVTYDNMGRFNCAIKCGKNISIDFRGACPVPVRGR